MPLRWLLAAGFLTLCGPALAQDFTPAKSCTDKTAAPATVNEVASNPAGFKGKCVKVQGWWRDIGIYASRGEAFQPDALSIVTLDERRLGLYLSDKDQAKAPPRAVMAQAVGVVGRCADIPNRETALASGYCRHKPGAYLAVARIGPAS